MPKKIIFINSILLFLYFSCSEKRTPVVKEQPIIPPPQVAPVPAKELTLSLSPEQLRTAEQGYPVGPWDALQITVWNHPDLTKQTIVRKDGTIYMPLISNVSVEGLSVQEVQKLLTEKLSYYIKNPMVDVEIKEFRSRQVYFLGSVNKPGVYSLIEETNILEALSLAGGPTLDGNLAGTFLIRNNKVYPLNLFNIVKYGDLTQNVILLDRDIIYVPSSKDMKIFVLGEVRSPGAIPFQNELSVIDAIAQAGGTLHSGKISRVKIIRGTLSNPTLINADVDNIINGDLSYKDYMLVPGDIVYVPKTVIASWNQIIEDITPTLQTLIISPLQATLQVLIYQQAIEATKKK